MLSLSFLSHLYSVLEVLFLFARGTFTISQKQKRYILGLILLLYATESWGSSWAGPFSCLVLLSVFVDKGPALDHYFFLFLLFCSQITKKLSIGEICVANFIPPANGASQGNYFLPKITQTDRQISLTPYAGVCRFFLSFKFSTSLPASLTGGS